ncbi:MAG: hypothetical protein N2517_05400 [Ignavibacteria bacterium]|nr:hypothetical protein [Ignavibacteria bacterium]
MKWIYIHKLIFFLTSFQIFAQGFPWEFSPRLPFKVPETFLGVSLARTNLTYFGNLTLYEDKVLCSKFHSGNGFAFSFAGNIEHWYLHNLAVNVYLGFQQSNGKFVALGDSFPILVQNIPQVVNLENELNIRYNYLALGFALKYLLFDTRFFVGISNDFGFKTSTKFEIFEQVKSPPEYHFTDKTQRRKLYEGEVPDLSFLVVSTKLDFGYDAVILPNIYASPKVWIELPIFNFSKEGSLRVFSFGFGLTLFYGYR